MANAVYLFGVCIRSFEHRSQIFHSIKSIVIPINHDDSSAVAVEHLDKPIPPTENKKQGPSDLLF